MLLILAAYFFFFKQKTAYEMRISDWSSDVCSSDLETADHGNLAGDHDVGRALDAVDQRLATAVQVIELGFGNRIVDVDGREGQLALLRHLVQTVHASRGRSEERRGGKECVRTCRSRWSQYH